MRNWIIAAACCVVFALSGCFQATEPAPELGGDSHFLQRCENTCEDGLSCVCGVCTRACTKDSSCTSLAKSAQCVKATTLGDEAQCGASDDEKEVVRACDFRCDRDGDCKSDDDDFACVDGSCRQKAKITPGADGGPSFEVDAGDAEGETAPLVMLLLDTSGSMERKFDCTCTNAGCKECMPDCSAGETNRWFSVVSAVSGSFENPKCEERARTSENGATYDLGYPVPHFAIMNGDQRRNDGVLDEYSARVRFGIATLDSMDTYHGANPLIQNDMFDSTLSSSLAGLYSYPSNEAAQTYVRPDGSLLGDFFYPNCKVAFRIDTGIRSSFASDGALRMATKLSDMPNVRRRIASDLLTVRPYGGSPIAASLDDLYFLFTEDTAGKRTASTKAKRVVVIVTDGSPDLDYRDYGCDCAIEGNCPEGNDPLLMHCPYPTAAEAARRLRCGYGSGACDGPTDKVYVVGLSTPDAEGRKGLDAIAEQGGTEAGRYAQDAGSLRDVLSTIMDEVLTD